MQKRGFTLTELLVVVGILAVLIAVLLPVFFAARQKAHQSTCATNLRQLAAASLLYAQDNDGVLPHAGTQQTFKDEWNYQIVPYVKTKRLDCPTFVLPDNSDFFAARPFHGYAANSNIDNAGLTEASLSLRDSDIPFPTATVLIAETHCTVKRTENEEDYGYPIDQANPAFGSTADGGTPIGLQGGVRHNGGSNYAFLDGHAKWHKPEAVDWSEHDKNGYDLPPPDGTRPTFRV